MYVANSEPVRWRRGSGRASAEGEAGYLGKLNRRGAGRDMGQGVRLTRETLLV